LNETETRPISPDELAMLDTQLSRLGRSQ